MSRASGMRASNRQLLETRNIHICCLKFAWHACIARTGRPARMPGLGLILLRVIRCLPILTSAFSHDGACGQASNKLY
jgi:hypothetical protein